MTDNLPDLLAQHGLKPRSLRAGAKDRVECPFCRAKDKSFSVAIDADGEGFTGHCFHGSCDQKLGARVHRDARPAYQPKEAYRRPPAIPLDEMTQDFATIAWFARRGITEETVEAFGVFIRDYQFYDKVTRDAIYFPYFFKGEVANYKIRAEADKKFMAQSAGAMPTLFNIDAVKEPDVVWWVEGEIDAMTLHQCGYPQVVSLKDGAAKNMNEEDDATNKRLEALNTHQEVLGAVQRFVLAGDMDEPGKALTAALARRFGRHKCWTVEWPDGCKDANETLMKHGADAVRAAIEAAQPFPIEGVRRPEAMLLKGYLKLPPLPVMKSGIDSVDAILKIPGEGRVIIVTGCPNSGKTQFAMNIMVNQMRLYGRRWCVFSPEFAPFEEFFVAAAEILVGKPARRPNKGSWTDLMGEREIAFAEEFLMDKLFYIEIDAMDKAPTLEYIFGKTEECILRYGATDLLIDPWNEVEISRNGMTEHEFIGRSLQAAREFGRRHGLNVWIVAHPTKMHPAKPGEDLKAPTGYDIAGSSHFPNKADLGLTIHTPANTTLMVIWKSRFTRWGRKNDAAIMAFDEATGRYYSPSNPGSQDEFQRLPYADN